MKILSLRINLTGLGVARPLLYIVEFFPANFMLFCYREKALRQWEIRTELSEQPDTIPNAKVR